MSQSPLLVLPTGLRAAPLWALDGTADGLRQFASIAAHQPMEYRGHSRRAAIVAVHQYGQARDFDRAADLVDAAFARARGEAWPPRPWSTSFERATSTVTPRDVLACVLASLAPLGERAVVAACAGAVAAGMDDRYVAAIAAKARAS